MMTAPKSAFEDAYISRFQMKKKQKNRLKKVLKKGILKEITRLK